MSATMNEGVIHESSGPRILTVNGGSSSIKFAMFAANQELRRILSGHISGVGLPKGDFTVEGQSKAESFSRSVEVADHTAAVQLLMDWVEEHGKGPRLFAVGHRVVHGGSKYWEPQRLRVPE
jgi:acetate kinase